MRKGGFVGELSHYGCRIESLSGIFDILFFGRLLLCFGSELKARLHSNIIIRIYFAGCCLLRVELVEILCEDGDEALKQCHLCSRASGFALSPNTMVVMRICSTKVERGASKSSTS